MFESLAFFRANCQAARGLWAFFRVQLPRQGTTSRTTSKAARTERFSALHEGFERGVPAQLRFENDSNLNRNPKP